MKFFPVLVFALTAVCSAPALAVDDDVIAGCAVMSSDYDRLACFDGVAADAGLDGPQPVAVEDSGKWSVTRDREAILVQLAANAQGSGTPASFVARCQSGRTEAYVLWNDQLGDDGNSDKRVTVRIGSGQSTNERWSLSTDAKATFSTGFPPALLKRMAAESAFSVQTTASDARQLTAVFDTTGMRQALVPLVETCGWRL